MGKYMIVMAVIMSVAQISAARNVNTSVVNLKDPVKTTSPYMTYEELLYILQSKHGYPSSPPKSLTPCARAILGCCEGKVMNENCSVSLKCGAYFFDDNPCEEKFIIEALEAAKIFYEQFNTIAG